MLLKSLLVFTKTGCSSCKNFVNVAKQMNIPVVEVNIEIDADKGVDLIESLKQDPETAGYRTLPIIEVATSKNGDGPYARKLYDLKKFNTEFKGLVGFLAACLRDEEAVDGK